MGYTSKYTELKSVFTSEKGEIEIPGSDVNIFNSEFFSDEPLREFLNKNDSIIPENRSFSYPVFAPADRKSDRVILLLHGLNERSWIKYLTWALWLAGNTGSWVVLFPISFHMNRSPEAWKDPRKMTLLMKERNPETDASVMSSFANAALSNRLAEDPLRFFLSGYRTVLDITKLAASIKSGRHTIVPESKKINFFAYSIGAFLAQIILMGNPGRLFSDSRLFMFCGGSVFSNMHGTSRLIMDRHAFDRVFSFYLNEFENTITSKNPLFDFLNSDRLGLSFRAMIDLERLKTFREKLLKSLSDQIHSISLLKDRIIPPAGIVETLDRSGTGKIVEIADLPYAYSHENPFPVFENSLSSKVDSFFERVFTSASLFLG